jgi:hypothetical protein
MRVQRHRDAAATAAKAPKAEARTKAKSVRKTERRGDVGPSSAALGMRRLAGALSRLRHGSSAAARGMQKLAGALKQLEPSPAALEDLHRPGAR